CPCDLRPTRSTRERSRAAPGSRTSTRPASDRLNLTYPTYLLGGESCGSVHEVGPPQAPAPPLLPGDLGRPGRALTGDPNDVQRRVGDAPAVGTRDLHDAVRPASSGRQDDRGVAVRVLDDVALLEGVLRAHLSLSLS